MRRGLNLDNSVLQSDQGSEQGRVRLGQGSRASLHSLYCQHWPVGAGTMGRSFQIQSHEIATFSLGCYTSELSYIYDNLMRKKLQYEQNVLKIEHHMWRDYTFAFTCSP